MVAANLEGNLLILERRLGAMNGEESGMQRLRRLGLVTDATKSPADLPPPLPAKPGQPTLGEILAEQREHER